GAHVLVARTEQEDKQRLRAAGGRRESLHLRGDKPPDGQASGSLTNLSRRFHEDGWI
ncbi:MAG: hypothetical protein AVDCRST_MAG22-1519, partial [uncultured Rubrobacteraceae bacterium]